jgi:hypothetical protein
LGLLASAAVLGAIGLRRPAGVGRTRYRTPRWSRHDLAVAGAALLATAATVVVVATAPAALRYEPYPAVAWPAVSLPLLAGIGLLLVPAFLVPAASRAQEAQ